MPTIHSHESFLRLCRCHLGAPHLVYFINWQPFTRQVTAYTDTSVASCKATQKSTSGGSILLGGHDLRQCYAMPKPSFVEVRKSRAPWDSQRIFLDAQYAINQEGVCSRFATSCTRTLAQRLVSLTTTRRAHRAFKKHPHAIHVSPESSRANAAPRHPCAPHRHPGIHPSRG